MQRAVVAQRVKSASVSVDGQLVASIGKGILALAAVDRNDTIKDSEKTANKLLNMRLWDDEHGARVCTYTCYVKAGVNQRHDSILHVLSLHAL